MTMARSYLLMDNRTRYCSLDLRCSAHAKLSMRDHELGTCNVPIREYGVKHVQPITQLFHGYANFPLSLGCLIDNYFPKAIQYD